MIKKIISTAVISTALLMGASNMAKANSNAYYKCYGEMTNAHKARGFQQSNREMSIQIKETVCSAYAKDQSISYEGKR